MAIEIDFTSLTQSELEKLREDTFAELERRRAEPYVQQGQAELIKQLDAAGITQPPSAGTFDEEAGKASAPVAWKKPGVAPSTWYRPQSTVTHAGSVWLSIFPGLNAFEPGKENGAAWKYLGEVTAPAAGAVPEFKAGVPVKKGDRRTWKGSTYEALIDHTTQVGWTPDIALTVWKKVK